MGWETYWPNSLGRIEMKANERTLKKIKVCSQSRRVDVDGT